MLALGCFVFYIMRVKRAHAVKLLWIAIKQKKFAQNTGTPTADIVQNAKKWKNAKSKDFLTNKAETGTGRKPQTRPRGVVAHAPTMADQKRK